MNYREYEEFIKEFLEKSVIFVKESNPPIPKDLIINNHAACYAIACSVGLLFAKSNYSIKDFAHNFSNAVINFLGL